MAKTAQSKARTPRRTPKTKRPPKKGTKKSSAAYEKPENGYMYIGHLPHGFYEEEIKSYFAQFGKIIRVRVARSKKTGNYRGYGFVQFADKDVAQVAADTMNNYLMFNKVLKCHMIPKERIHPDTFRNAGKLFVKPVSSWMRKSFNRKRSVEQLKKLREKQERKMTKRAEKLKELGINLDLSKLSQFPSSEEVKPEKAAKKAEKKTAVESVEPPKKAAAAEPTKKVEAPPKKVAAEPKKAAEATPKKAAVAAPPPAKKLPEEKKPQALKRPAPEAPKATAQAKKSAAKPAVVAQPAAKKLKK